MSQNNPRWCQSNKKVKNKNLIRIFFWGGGARSVNQAILGQNFVNSIHLENTLSSLMSSNLEIVFKITGKALNCINDGHSRKYKMAAIFQKYQYPVIILCKTETRKL